MIDLERGTVVAVTPDLLIRLDGDVTAAVTESINVWTPAVGQRVVVAVNARTRARLYALGPVTAP